MRQGKVQWKAFLTCSIMLEARVNNSALPGIPLPGLGDNLVQLELDLPQYCRLLWQSLICGTLWLPSSGQALPCWLNFLACPQIYLVITVPSGSHQYVSWPWLLSWTCSFLFRCHGTVPLSERAWPCPPCCDSWLPAPLFFPSSWPLYSLTYGFKQVKKWTVLFIFIAEVGNKMFILKGVSIK